MLGKLLKYDFRANLKIFLFIWPAIVVFALLERLLVEVAFSAGSIAQILVIMTLGIFALALTGACIFAFVVSVIRFYSGLLRDEGYLMFTLPVKSWQLVLSKLISAFVFIAVTCLLSVASGYFLLDAVPHFTDMLRFSVQTLAAQSGMNTALLLLVAVNVAISPAVLILQVYFSCSVGHLGKRLRVLWSILTFYGVNVAVQMVNMAAVLIFSSSLFDRLGVNEMQTAVLAQTVAGAENLILGIVFFFVSERILRKHLNLE